MSAPTGGTWCVCTSAPNSCWRGDGTEVYSEYGRIAETHCNGLRRPEEARANACLIAAAPELHMALNLLLPLAHAALPQQMTNEQRALYDEWFSIAYAAIAKAEGK